MKLLKCKACFYFCMLGLLFLSFYRLFLGVDIIDESWYLAMAYRFHLGDTPFLEEKTLYQLSSLLYYPVVALHLNRVGTMEGVVLFTRFINWILTLWISFVVFRRLCLSFRTESAIISTLFLLFFIPGTIPNFGYNSLSGLFFTLGVILVVSELAEGKRSLVPFFMGGISHGLAIWAHPGFALSIAFFSAVLFLYLCKRKITSNLIVYAAACLIPLVCMGAIASPQKLVQAYLFQKTLGNDPSLRSFFSFSYFSLSFKKMVFVVGLVGLFVFMKYSTRFSFETYLRFRFLIPLCFVGAAICGFGSGGFLVYLVLFAPLFYRLFPFHEKNRTYLNLGWIPSIFSFFSLAVVSSIHNGNPGLMPAVFVTVLFSCEALLLEWEKKSLNFFQTVVLMLPLLLLVGRTAEETLNRYGPFQNQILSGPFRGVKTNSKKAAFLRQIESDLKPYQNGKGKILAYDQLPIVYLLTTMRPGVPTVYACFPVLASKGCWDDYEKNIQPGNIVVRSVYPGFEEFPLNRGIEKSHDVILTRSEYSILKSREPE